MGGKTLRGGEGMLLGEMTCLQEKTTGPEEMNIREVVTGGILTPVPKLTVCTQRTEMDAHHDHSIEGMNGLCPFPDHPGYLRLHSLPYLPSNTIPQASMTNLLPTLCP